MTSANQTPGEYKFAPLVASQQGRAKQHEPASFGLSFLCSFPSRSGIPLHAVVQPWLSLQRSILPWNVPPLVLRHSPSSWAAVVHWSTLMPKALRSSRKHPIHSFPAPPHSPRPPPFLRTSRTSAAVSYPPRAPQIPQARSASCVKSPRCSHFPSWALLLLKSYKNMTPSRWSKVSSSHHYNTLSIFLWIIIRLFVAACVCYQRELITLPLRVFLQRAVSSSMLTLMMDAWYGSRDLLDVVD